MVFVDGKWQPDPLIQDDRAIVFNVKKKGLLVLSGCAHAGKINTALYAKQLTGVRQIYAIMGGVHLAGKDCETRIKSTVEQLKQLDPKIVAPSHCTGVERSLHNRQRNAQSLRMEQRRKPVQLLAATPSLCSATAAAPTF